MMEIEIRFHILASTDAQEQGIVTTELQIAGVGQIEIIDAHGSAPLDEILIVGSSSLTALTFAIERFRRMFKRGVFIDARSSRSLSIRSDKSIPRGMVVIRHRSGEIEVRDAEGLQQNLLAILAKRGGDQASGANPSGSGADV
ncbi:hypothetical protein [Streptomyces sp. NPDC059466]|uniref:hypothetical protein n=1 Tax=unclassified Streptomyces TaxID=2593676 RepID=UPI0036C60C3E